MVAKYLCLALALIAHPGGLDQNGGHHDRRNGGYHFHAYHGRSTPPPAPIPIAFASPTSREDSYRTAARSSARTDVRTTARTNATRTVVSDLKATKKHIEAAIHEFRTWNDASGRFAVVARFAGYTAGSVRLIKKDATEITVDIEILSDSDKSYLRDLFASKGIALGR